MTFSDHIDALLVSGGALILALAVLRNASMLARLIDLLERIWRDGKGRW